MLPVRGAGTTSMIIIGDAPYGTEAQRALPFSSAASNILAEALHANNITFNSCLSTTLLSKALPRDEELDTLYVTSEKAGLAAGWEFINGLYASPTLAIARRTLLEWLDNQHANVVLLCGDLAMWAVTGERGVHTRRGSIYPSVKLPSGRTIKTVSTYSIRSVTQQLEYKPIFDRDVQRAAKESAYADIRFPKWNFVISDDFQIVCNTLYTLLDFLNEGPRRLAVDIETIAHSVACVGIAWTKTDAVCIPIRTNRMYWTVHQHLAIIDLLRRVLEHRNARCVWQNGHYDVQYLGPCYGIAPRTTDDTMIAQHLLFVGMPKSLAFIASVYCEYYVYWKDELKDYNTAPDDDMQFFEYNLKDVCYTYEAMDSLDRLLDMRGHRERYTEIMEHTWWSVLFMMLRGVLVNQVARSELASELFRASEERAIFLDTVIGRPFNPGSSKQMKEFFIEEMGVKPRKNRAGRVGSLDAEVLVGLRDEYPLLCPLIDAIIEQRSIGVFNANFIQAKLDRDGRMRSSYGLAGTETFRFSSSTNAHGRGGNLQNIPKGDRAKTSFKMPNIRKLFVPDPGWEIFDIDLAGADAQVVAWEAGDEKLKAAFRAGLKIHAVNAKDLFGGDAGPDGKREPYYTRTKMGVHLTNYGGKAPTMAKALGILIHEADKFQRRWFEIHPEIQEWHERTQREIDETSKVVNVFGYERVYFGRKDRLLPEALAWKPQSTVAIVARKAQDIIEERHPLAKIIMQVHDSLVFQLPILRPVGYEQQILDDVRIVCPYEDPLIIPFGMKSSTLNWGECG